MFDVEERLRWLGRDRTLRAPGRQRLTIPASVDRYGRHYGLYRELYNQLAPLYPRLATS
jgi:hypothetical protein